MNDDALNGGLPPNCAAGQWLGFSEDGHAFILQWSDPRKAWLGIGFDPLYAEDNAPLAFVAIGDRADFIVRHRAIHP